MSVVIFDVYPIKNDENIAILQISNMATKMAAVHARDINQTCIMMWYKLYHIIKHVRFMSRACAALYRSYNIYHNCEVYPITNDENTALQADIFCILTMFNHVLGNGVPP